MQGIFPILLTPFDDEGRIDEESLVARSSSTWRPASTGSGWRSAASS